MGLLGFLKNHSSVSQVGSSGCIMASRGVKWVHDDVIRRSSGVKWVHNGGIVKNHPSVYKCGCMMTS